MFNILLIFGAKYLYLAPIIVAIIYFLKQSRVTRKQMVILGVFVLPLTYITAQIAGALYYDPRPFVQSGIAPLISHAADNGFPSDHTLLCASIAAVLYPFNKKLSMLAWTLAILVGLARVFAGIHHLIDISASIVIAMAVGTLVYNVFKNSYLKAK